MHFIMLYCFYINYIMKILKKHSCNLLSYFNNKITFIVLKLISVHACTCMHMAPLHGAHRINKILNVSPMYLFGYTSMTQNRYNTAIMSF